MSVSAVSNNQYDQYAYLDKQIDSGGAYTSYANTTDTSVRKQETTSNEPSTKASDDTSLFGKDGFGFDDFLDIINPLQHIPIVSTLYRELTGDELSPGARMIGGGIFGGGIGLAASVVNTVIEAETGKDIGEQVMAMFTDTASDNDNPATGAVAKALATTPAVTIASESPVTITQKAMPAITSAAPPPAAGVPLSLGLQWKNQIPDLQRNIEQVRALQEKNLTPAQVNQILNSFKLAPQKAASPTSEQISETSLPARAATQYQKAANISDASDDNSYDYMNKLI